jgi:hypothetical protein
MRRSSGCKAATVGLLGAITLATASTSATAAKINQESLTVDKATVHAGNTVTLRFSHGGESIEWISSPAFVREGEHPFGAAEGLARVVSDKQGNASAVATIGTVKPGSYVVHTRVGGGCGPTAIITVVR